MGLTAVQKERLAQEAREEMDELIVRTDFYGGSGDFVSIEDAGEEVLDLQEALDLQVVAENRGVLTIERGLPPCIRVKKES